MAGRPRIFTLLPALLFVAGFALESAYARKLRWVYIEFPPVFSTNDNGDAEGELIDLDNQKI